MAPKMLGFVTAFVVTTAAALITQRAEAETHTVGDATGWTNIVDSDTYSSWAAKHTFKVGDTLGNPDLPFNFINHFFNLF